MSPEDDLDTIVGSAWADLERAAADRDSQLRHAQIASTGSHGWPQLRTVSIRHADAAQRQVGFHTDCRSAKCVEMDADTSVALVAYDRPRELQIRLWGQAELHVEDMRAKAEWEALYPPLRIPYRTAFAPGRPIDTPGAADPTEAARNAKPNAGFENFGFVAIRIIRLEWLQLRPGRGHRRARFEWNGGWDGSWLAP